jgi:hypothetical protein
MAKVNDIDYLTDDNGDLIIENGDFKKGDATLQHVRDILLAAPGHYRQFPTIGADIGQMVNGELDVEMKKKIRMNLTADGYKVNDIKLVNGIIQIDAERV